MNRPGEGNLIVGFAEAFVGYKGMTHFSDMSVNAYDVSAAGFGLGGGSLGEIAIRELMMIVHQPGLLLGTFGAAPSSWANSEAAHQLFAADIFGAAALVGGGIAILGLSDIRRGADNWGGRNR